MTPHEKILLYDAARALLAVVVMGLIALVLICLILVISCSA